MSTAVEHRPPDNVDEATEIPVEVVEETFDAWNHELTIGLCVVALVLSFLLEVRPDEGVSFRFLPDWRLPESCGARQWVGIDCPGCGLTRSFVRLAEGDWRASVAVHPLGWIIAGFAAFQIPYRIAALRTRRNRPFGLWPRYCAWAVILALFVVWGVRWGPKLLG